MELATDIWKDTIITLHGEVMLVMVCYAHGSAELLYLVRRLDIVHNFSYRILSSIGGWPRHGWRLGFLWMSDDHATTDTFGC